MSKNDQVIAAIDDVLVRIEEFRAPVKVAPRNTRHLFRIASISIVVLYAFLRLRHIGGYSLWYDEVFSVFVARSSWANLFRQILIDRVHPPLFYVLLKLWIAAVGVTVINLRLFSLLCSVLTLLPLWSCMKQIRLSRFVSLSLLFALASNTFLIFYSQEVRMYSLLWFLSVWSLDLYLKQKHERLWPRYLWIAVNVMLVMVHIAGIAVIVCEIAHAAFTRARFRKRLLDCVPALLALVAWIIAVKMFSAAPDKVLHNVAWIPKPTLALQWKTVAHLLGGGAGPVVLTVPLLVALWRNRQNQSSFTSLFLLLSVATIAFVFAFSLTIRPIWQERYLIIAVVPYYLLAGDCIQRMRPKWALGCAVAIVAAGLVSLEYDLTHRPDRPAFASFVTPAVEPIFASDDMVGTPLAVHEYSRQDPVRVIKSVAPLTWQGLGFTVRDVAYSVGQRDGILGEQHISASEFLYAYDRNPDPSLPAGPTPKQFASYGCSERELAKTNGEGHDFVLIKVNCTQTHAKKTRLHSRS